MDGGGSKRRNRFHIHLRFRLHVCARGGDGVRDGRGRRPHCDVHARRHHHHHGGALPLHDARDPHVRARHDHHHHHRHHLLHRALPEP